jgi:hypothetical protein
VSHGTAIFRRGYPLSKRDFKEVMKASAAFVLTLATVSGIVQAETIPLYCKDFVALTETAVQQRDSKISKAKSLQYLGSDEFMSNRDKTVVRQMIERVYQKTSEGRAYHVDQTKNECTTKLTNAR